MRLDDPDFTFEKQREARRRLIAPGIKRKSPGWKISGEDKPKPERWRVEYDAHGKIVLIEEVVPPTIPTDGPHRPSARSKFEILLTEETFVGGHACGPGCRVIAFSYSAGGLLGRGRILSEERNSF